jgi:hypothetical protein
VFLTARQNANRIAYSRWTLRALSGELVH